MLINRYIDLRYKSDFQEHLKDRCYCDLKQGGTGLCLCGKYIEGLITAQDFLKRKNDELYNIQYGTFVRTQLDEIARIIDIDVIQHRIYFILDREINDMSNGKIIRTKIIKDYNIDKYSNELKDIVKIGDIVNGHKIIKIDEDNLWYGYWGNEYLKGEIREVLAESTYRRNSIVS